MSNGTNPGAPGLPGKIADYRPSRHIGGSRLGAVFLAHDERMNRTVVLKVLAPFLAGDGDFRSRFLRASEAAATVGHPNIVPVYEVGDTGQNLFIAMRYAQGGDAGSLVRQAGPLPPAGAWNIIAQIASALDAAHARGLVHSDVKPSNMLLDSAAAGPVAPGSGQVYLSDFGMGPGLAAGASPAAAGQDQGTPGFDYTAPEQAAGQSAGPRSDLYSLACAGYELLCGGPPFGRDQGMTARYAHLYARPPTVTALRPDLPADVDIVLATALAKDPADRYPGCGEFAEALRTALRLARGPVSAPAAAPGGPAQPSAPGRSGAAAPGSPPPAVPAASVARQPDPGTQPDESFMPMLVGPDGLHHPAGSNGTQPAPGSGGTQAPAGTGDTQRLPGSGGSQARAGSGDTQRPPRRGRTQPRAATGGPQFPATGGPQFPAAGGGVQPGSGPGRAQPPPGMPPALARTTGGPYGPYPGADDPFPGDDERYPGPGQPYHAPGGLYIGPAGAPVGPAQQHPAPSPQPGGASGQYAETASFPDETRQARPYPGLEEPAPEPAEWLRQPVPPPQGQEDWYRGEQYAGGAGRPPRLGSRPGGKRLVIAATVVTVVVVGIIVGVVLSHGTAGHPSPGPQASGSRPATPSVPSGAAPGQARAINNLLSSSAAARKSLPGAVANALQCRNVPGAISQLQSVVNQRRSEVTQASALSVSALTNGAALKSDLVAALHSSLGADQDYLTWAQQQTSGCKPGRQTPAYRTALGADSQAASAKKAFVAVWNPVASTYGLPQQTVSTF